MYPLIVVIIIIIIIIAVIYFVYQKKKEGFNDPTKCKKWGETYHALTDGCCPVFTTPAQSTSSHGCGCIGLGGTYHAPHNRGKYCRISRPSGPYIGIPRGSKDTQTAYL